MHNMVREPAPVPVHIIKNVAQEGGNVSANVVGALEAAEAKLGSAFRTITSGGTDEWRYDEDPELANSRATKEDGWRKATSWVDGCTSKINTDKVNKG